MTPADRDHLRGLLVVLVRAAQRVEPTGNLAALDEQLRAVHAAAFQARSYIAHLTRR